MFECKCCEPARQFSYKKSLYRHQKTHDPNYVDPRQRETDERRRLYEIAPILCGCCSKQITFEQRTADPRRKFCSQSCAARVNNKPGVPRKRVVHCLTCEAPLANRAKQWCSLECHREHRLRKIDIPKFERGEVENRPTLKKRLVELTGWVCGDCENTEWKGEPIPLELDHIDGNAANNLPNNLRLLCPNCHAMTPTAKGKNKGNGRKSRGLSRG